MREFLKVESKKRVDSDNDERFFCFRAEDIVLREAVADLDFDVTEVSSVHASD